MPGAFGVVVALTKAVSYSTVDTTRSSCAFVIPPGLNIMTLSSWTSTTVDSTPIVHGPASNI